MTVAVSPLSSDFTPFSTMRSCGSIARRRPTPMVTNAPTAVPVTSLLSPQYPCPPLWRARVRQSPRNRGAPGRGAARRSRTARARTRRRKNRGFIEELRSEREESRPSAVEPYPTPDDRQAGKTENPARGRGLPNPGGEPWVFWTRPGKKKPQEASGKDGQVPFCCRRATSCSSRGGGHPAGRPGGRPCGHRAGHRAGRRSDHRAGRRSDHSERHGHPGDRHSGRNNRRHPSGSTCRRARTADPVVPAMALIVVPVACGRSTRRRPALPGGTS